MKSKKKSFTKEMFIFNIICNLIALPFSILFYVFTGGSGSLLFTLYFIIDIILIFAYFFVGRYYKKKEYKSIFKYFLLLTVIGFALVGCDILADHITESLNISSFLTDIVKPSALTNFSQTVHMTYYNPWFDFIIVSERYSDTIKTFIVIILENLLKLATFLLGNRARKNDNGKK